MRMNATQKERIKRLAVALLKALGEDINKEPHNGVGNVAPNARMELRQTTDLFMEAALVWEPGQTPEEVVSRLTENW